MDLRNEIILFNIVSGSDANITTPCEMEIFNFLFGEPTWFYVVHPNLDATLGVAMGVKGVYPSMWELRVCSGPR